MAQLTVMTWNVQNLFPPGHPESLETPAEYRARLRALAAIIDDVAPDVVALQEVGGVEVLVDLNDACAIDFDNRMVGIPDSRGIRVALMSPRRLSNRRDVTALPPGVLPVQTRDLRHDDPATTDNEALADTTGRGVLSATVRSAGRRVTIITCHLKSKLITYPSLRAGGGPSRFAPLDEGERLRYAGYAVMRRTAEAMTCRSMLDGALTADGDEPGTGPGTGTDTPVILLGDLNDEPRAATTQIIQGPGGSEIDFRSRSGFQTPDRGDGWRMWNLSRLLPADEPPATRIYRGRGELIDHVFGSHTLVNPDNIPTVELVAATPLPSMGNDPTVTTSGPTDHAAVVATFTV